MIVSNTSPLIALAKVDLLSLLQSLFEEVRIPPAVHRELLAKTGEDAARLDRALKHFIVVAPAPASTSPAQERVTQGIGEGEGQAVLLARELGSLLLIDERAGRTAARRLGVPVTGTVGVLIRAKEIKLVTNIVPTLHEMRREGYWLSDHLIELAARHDDEG